MLISVAPVAVAVRPFLLKLDLTGIWPNRIWGRDREPMTWAGGSGLAFGALPAGRWAPSSASAPRSADAASGLGSQSAHLGPRVLLAAGPSHAASLLRSHCAWDPRSQRALCLP